MTRTYDEDDEPKEDGDSTERARELLDAMPCGACTGGCDREELDEGWQGLGVSLGKQQWNGKMKNFKETRRGKGKREVTTHQHQQKRLSALVE